MVHAGLTPRWPGLEDDAWKTRLLVPKGGFLEGTPPLQQFCIMHCQFGCFVDAMEVCSKPGSHPIHGYHSFSISWYFKFCPLAVQASTEEHPFQQQHHWHSRLANIRSMKRLFCFPRFLDTCGTPCGSASEHLRVCLSGFL